MFSDSKSLSDLRSLNSDGGLLAGCQRKQKFSAIFQPLQGAMKKKRKKSVLEDYIVMNDKLSPS